MPLNARASSPSAVRLAFLAPITLLTFLALTEQPQAACGLSYCPRPEEPGRKELELSLMAREAGFDLHGVSGRYTELMAAAQHAFLGRLVLGLHAPFILLHLEEETEYGLGNLLTFAEWRMRPAFLSAFGFGMQLEIPTGAADRGLADDHFMAAPYASLAAPAGPVMLGLALGTAFTLHGGHGEGGGHAPHGTHDGTESGATRVFVHPHEDWEALYRISAGLRFLEGRFLPEGFLDGQQVLSSPDDPGAPLHYIAAGVSLPFAFGAAVLSPSASVPLLPDSRFEWSAGLHLTWKLGLGRPRAPAPGET